MTQTHALSVPPPSLARLAPRAAPAGAALPSLRRTGARSLTSGLILAFLLLALLLQASFFAGLAAGAVAGPDASVAARATRR